MTLAWNQQPISRKMEMALKEGLIKAVEQGLDLKKTYLGTFITKCFLHFLADVYVKQGANLSSRMMTYIKGRGRYGPTPHPKLATLELILQERNEPFSIRVNDPL